MNLIRLICIDEAHTVAQDGRNFRPEFDSAVTTLRNIYEVQQTTCNRIAMSAMFRKCEQDVISKLFDRPLDTVMWLELSRRKIQSNVTVSGNPICAVTSSLKEDYKYKMDMETIVYSNSKQQAVGTISAAMESVLEQSPNGGEVIPLTGDDGLQFKVYTMHVFSQAADDLADEIVVSDPMSLLPNLQIMPTTKAADCGVSSKRCWRSYRIRLASSMYSLLQEMGWVDRDPLAGIGDNQYEVRMNFLCSVS